MKGLGPCDRVKGRVYAKKRKGVFTVKRRERGSASIHGRSAKKKSIFNLPSHPKLH